MLTSLCRIIGLGRRGLTGDGMIRKNESDGWRDDGWADLDYLYFV